MIDRLVCRTLSSLSLNGLEEFTYEVEQKIERWTRVLKEEGATDVEVWEGLEVEVV
jgi:hypothetical protein